MEILLGILGFISVFIVLGVLYSLRTSWKTAVEKLAGLGKIFDSSETKSSAEPLLLLLGIGIAGWFVKPDIYTEWIPNNAWLAAFVIIGTMFLFFFNPPKRTGMLYWVLFALTAIAVFATLPKTTQENILAWKPWPATTNEADRERNKEVRVADSGKIELPPVIARYGTFTEIADIPPEFGRIDFMCPPGVLLAIVHKSLPGGSVKDCGKDEIGLGNDLEELRLWVRSKNPDEKIPVVLAYIPRNY